MTSSQGNRLLLDTPVLVWILEDDSRLGTRTRTEIVKAREAGSLHVSLTSLWKLGRLAAGGKIHVPDLRSWWLEAVRRLRMKELPVERHAILDFFELEEMHNAPFDQFLVATALRQDLRLVTANEKILTWFTSWSSEEITIDARK